MTTNKEIKPIYDLTEQNDEPPVVAHVTPAGVKATEFVLAQPVDPDGRSEWNWIWLNNGDCILGVFPCGDTYFSVEEDFGPNDITEDIEPLFPVEPNNDAHFLAEYNRLTGIENEDWGPDEEDDWYHLSCAMTHRLAAILKETL